MKKIAFLFILSISLFHYSCRETKNNAEEAEDAIIAEKIDSIETVVEEMSAEIEKETETLEQQLQTLDSL